MPRYDLHCPACSHRYQTFAHMREREALRCERCGGGVETDWSDQRAPAVEQEWHGTKRLSVGLVITDEERDEVLRECPAVEVNRAGQIVSHSRRHHRKQLEQLGAYKRRNVEKEAPVVEAEKRAREKAMREMDVSPKTKELIRGYIAKRQRLGA